MRRPPCGSAGRAVGGLRSTCRSAGQVAAPAPAPAAGVWEPAGAGRRSVVSRAVGGCYVNAVGGRCAATLSQRVAASDRARPARVVLLLLCKDHISVVLYIC